MTVLDGPKPGICIVCGRKIPKRLETMSFSHSDEAAPTSKAACQALTNKRIVAIRYWHHGRVRDASLWDGQTYTSEWFCTNNCAMDQGNASAHHGYRFLWKLRS